MRARFILLHKLETILFVLKVPMKMKWIHTVAVVSFSSDKSVQSRADQLCCMLFISSKKNHQPPADYFLKYILVHTTLENGKNRHFEFYSRRKKVLYWVFFLYLGVK